MGWRRFQPNLEWFGSDLEDDWGLVLRWQVAACGLFAEQQMGEISS